MAYYAHSSNKAGNGNPLRDHLHDVARRAAEYAEAFNASDEAYLAGLLHDLGKYGKLFQDRLKGKESGIDHWSAGAWTALTNFEHYGIASALAIQGHHLGIQQASKDSLSLINPASLKDTHPLGLRLSEIDINVLLQLYRNDGLDPPGHDPHAPSLYGGLDGPSCAAMLDVRMLFSALVDADFIETESHFNAYPDGSRRYRKSAPALEPERSLETLTHYLEDLAKNNNAPAHVNHFRKDLLNACLDAASLDPGLFTLTAPTGTGKTLSMLSFALKHAKKNKLRRIIIVIPYLTIIEQSVDAFQKAFAAIFEPEAFQQYVLEHHSLSGTRERKGAGAEEAAGMEHEGYRVRRLLSENWDAPIIVTTSVQFLESLFANRPSSCRKLHRLAQSVILFDEVQTLSTSLAVPTLATLSRLVERYNSTVVFSTATQPAFTHLDRHVAKYCAGGWKPREIVPQSLSLFKRAKRTRVTWPDNHDSFTSWAELAERISSPDYARSLCVVNLKKHALALHEKIKSLGAEGLFHLSTSMCPVHRQTALEKVRNRLAKGEHCRLISTQCVEAGVDLDFPTVFRAWGPLDAIAQAAGRCNRNGRADSGEVIVFMPEEERYPDAAYRQAADITRIVFKKHGSEGLDIHDPHIFEEYYRTLYDLVRPENRNRELLAALDIRDFVGTASHYRIIRQNAINVLVPYDTKRYNDLADEARQNGLNGQWISKARPYTISLFRPGPTDMVASYLDAVPVGRTEVSEEWFIYLKEEHYDPQTGLVSPESMEVQIA